MMSQSHLMWDSTQLPAGLHFHLANYAQFGQTTHSLISICFIVFFTNQVGPLSLECVYNLAATYTIGTYLQQRHSITFDLRK